MPVHAKPRDENAAERIQHALSLEILRGERAPGSRLPSIRALAQRFEVTVPTVQRVVARMEALQLLEVRHGSGMTVRDPKRHGGLALLPLWFEAYAEQPDRAVEVLADFLELRRVFAAHLLAHRREALLRAAPALALDVAKLWTSPDFDTLVDIDLSFTRRFLEASGSFAAVTLFQTVERLVRDVPYVAEALYGDPGDHRQMVGQVATLVTTESDPDRRAARLLETLADWDARATARFRQLLTGDETCMPS